MILSGTCNISPDGECRFVAVTVAFGLLGTNESLERTALSLGFRLFDPFWQIIAGLLADFFLHGFQLLENPVSLLSDLNEFVLERVHR